MYKLFWEKGAGSIVVQAVLEEAGVEYEKSYVDMGAYGHKSEDYLNNNPTGLVPALMLPNARVIGESAAIVLYLGEQHAEAGLAPSIDDQERSEFLFWLFYMATAGYPTSSRLWHPEQFTKNQSEDIQDSIRVVAEEDTARLFGLLENGIKGSPFFLESGFSALDLYLAMLLVWHPNRVELFRASPKLAKLYAAIELRPSFQVTMRDHS